MLFRIQTSLQIFVVCVRLLAKSLLTRTGRVCDGSNQTANSPHAWLGAAIFYHFSFWTKRVRIASVRETLGSWWICWWMFLLPGLTFSFWYSSGKGQCRTTFVTKYLITHQHFLFLWWCDDSISWEAPSRRSLSKSSARRKREMMFVSAASCFYVSLFKWSKIFVSTAHPTGFPSEERMRKRRNWRTSRKPWKVSVLFQWSTKRAALIFWRNGQERTHERR